MRPKLLNIYSSRNTYNVCSKLNNNISLLYKISHRKSSAFDPFNYLHYDTVREKQAETFKKIWDENVDNFKERMNGKELDLMEDKINKSRKFDEFENKMAGLWGPERHHVIRTLRTWKVTNDALLEYTKDFHASNLVFGNNDVFDEFYLKYVNDNENLLKDFEYCDLRYMCAVQAIEYLCGLKITAAFGCRNTYHYSYPTAIGVSANWQLKCYDKIKSRELCLLTVIQNLKEDKPLSPKHFEELFNGLEHNAYKEEEWRMYAQFIAQMPQEKMNDQLDRIFNRFQTDSGVTQLTIRYDSDLNYEAYYDEGLLYGEQDMKWLDGPFTGFNKTCL